MKKNGNQLIRACVGVTLLALMGLVPFATNGSMLTELGRSHNKIDHHITVVWEVDASPLLACRREGAARSVQVVYQNGACASVRRAGVAADHVCKIITSPVTTHQEIGAFLQWCLISDAAFK
jgi:hypothetical protein